MRRKITELLGILINGINNRIKSSLQTSHGTKQDKVWFFYAVLMRAIRVSTSAIIKATKQGKEWQNAYLLMIRLRPYVKHPVFFDFHANRTAIRLLSGLTTRKFNESLKSAISLGLASIDNSGNLHILSNNQHWIFKGNKKNDYQYTKDPEKFLRDAVVTNYYHKQDAKIRGKQRQTKNLVRYSEFVYQKSVAPQTKQQINYDITLSCRALSKLLNENSPSTGFLQKKELVKDGLINLKPNRVEIQKEEAITHIKAGRKNIRRDKDTNKWYCVLADLFELNNVRNKSVLKVTETIKEVKKGFTTTPYFSIHF